MTSRLSSMRSRCLSVGMPIMNASLGSAPGPTPNIIRPLVRWSSSTRSRWSASVGFCPTGWKGAMKMPKRTGGGLSVEEVGLLGDDVLVVRLEAELAAHRRTDLAPGDRRELGVDVHGRAGR